MNIFMTSDDGDPIECAQALCNRRVNNQVRETGQLLCTALQFHGVVDDKLMKPTHAGHPVSKWVRETRSNWEWTFEHFLALGEEKQVRYPDNAPHATYLRLRDYITGTAIPAGPLTPFANCARRKDLDIDFTDVAEVPLAYKLYMITRWELDSVVPSFSNRGEPEWR